MYGRRYNAWLAVWIGIYALLLFGSIELLDGRVVTWPVSYTHLDVYKRQILKPGMIIFEGEVDEEQMGDW